MKLNKIISAISAMALSFSMLSAFTVAEASLGGKPVATAEFVEYTTNSKVSWAKAWVKVTIDFSSAEELAAYKEEMVYDEEEEDDVLVKTGNGLTTHGLEITNENANFVPQETNCTAPADTFTLKPNGNGYTAAFGPQNVAANYYTDSTKLEYLVNFKVTSDNFDDTTKIGLGVTLDGKNTTEGSVWKYSSLAGTISVNTLDIPSYNEWSTPDEPVVDDVWTSDEVSSIPEGKKIVAHSENATVTADSRVSITVDGTTKLFGETISAYLAKKDIILDGEATANVRFALLVNEAANEITFNVQ